MDDVYRHYIPQKKMKKKYGVHEENFDEFDGEVTGYAMQAPLPSGKVGLYGEHNEDEGNELQPFYNSKTIAIIKLN